MCSWVEMGLAIGSLHHKSLHHKAKDIVVPDKNLVIYEKLRTGSEKKDEWEEEIEHNKKSDKKGKMVRIERKADKKRRVERIEENIEVEKREEGYSLIKFAPTQYEVGGLHSLGKFLHNICPIGT